MLKFIILLFLFDFFVPSLCRYKLGEPCNVKNVTGVCKYLYECQYAKKLISVDKVEAPICTFQNRMEISCCPRNNPLYETGVFKDYFTNLGTGIKKSKYMTCRYDGYEPLLCCENSKPVNISEETGCPELPKPKLKTSKTHIAWTKCLDYQRYFNLCLPNGTRENTCKIYNNKFRIAYGTDAKSEEFPHMAVLGCRNANPNDTDIIWVGGGSLISEKFILTAAHVLSEPKHGLVKYALLGTLNKTDSLTGLLYNIINIIPHTLYQYGSHVHDIALVEVDRQVSFNQFIRPLCLPVPGLEAEDYYLIAGWGGTSENKGGSDILLTGLVLPNKECETRTSFKDFIWSDEQLICAKGLPSGHGTSDTCEGDSGGPLMSLIKNINCSYSIQGVVSFGPKCGNNAPAAYTRVSYYLDWIVENVWPDHVQT